MDKPIQSGDLVQIVRPTPCCGENSGLGWTFVAGRISTYESRCRHCSVSYAEPLTAGAPNGIDTRLSRLKRIPPLSELDGLRSEDEMDIFDFLYI